MCSTYIRRLKTNVVSRHGHEFLLTNPATPLVLSMDLYCVAFEATNNYDHIIQFTGNTLFTKLKLVILLLAASTSRDVLK